MSEPVARVQSHADPSPSPFFVGKTACERPSRRGRAWPHFTSPWFLRRRRHIRSKPKMRLYVARGQRARESSSAIEIGPTVRVAAPRSAIATYHLTSMRSGVDASGTRGYEIVSEPVARVQSRADPPPCPLWLKKTARERPSRRGRAWPHFTPHVGSCVRGQAREGPERQRFREI